MKTKFKAGDKVVATKPNNQSDESVRLVWIRAMDTLDKQILKVKETDKSNNIYLCTKDGHSFWFHESWLTKVGEGVINEDVKTEEIKTIDWEQRRWELASKLFSLTSHEQAISSADGFIEHYKQTLK